MSATTIRELLVRIGVDAGDSGKSVAQLDDAIGSLKDTALKVVAGIAAVSVAIGGLVLSAAGAADAIDKGSQAAALTTDAYQELSFAASQAGTDIELLSKALGKQSTALAQMKEGTGTANDALNALGVTYQDLAGLTVDQQFEATATAISSVTNEQGRLQAATAIYGEEMAQRLMPILAIGGSGIAALRGQAQELGLVLGEEGVEAGVKFTDTLDQVWTLLGSIKNRIGLELVPRITGLLERFLDWYEANEKIIGQRLDKSVELISVGIDGLVHAVEAADKIVVAAFGGWEPLILGVSVAVAALSAAMVGLGALKVWLAIEAALAGIGIAGAASFGAVAVAAIAVAGWLVAVGLAVDDLYTYLTGGDSAIGQFVERFQDADGILGAVARQIPVVAELFSTLWDTLSLLGDLAYQVFEVAFLPGIQAVGDLVMWLISGPLALLQIVIEDVIKPALMFLTTSLANLNQGLAAIGMGGADTAASAGISTSKSASAFAKDASSAAASSSFAPAMAALPTVGAATTNVQVQGSQLTVSGVGLSAEDVQRLFESMAAEQARQTAAALDGAPA